MGLAGLGQSAKFQLNNSWIGLQSGPYNKNSLGIRPANGNFTGKPDGCFDQNGQSIACNTQKAGLGTGADGTDTGPNGACNNTLAPANQPDCDLWSTGVLGVAKVPGVYEFQCFYHHSAGMIGYLVVLPNSAYKP